VQRSILAAAAGLVLSTACVFAATPEELYQTWQQDSLHRPETAESAAEDYLRAAPTGPHAQELQLWLDAYRRAMANILAGASRRAAAPKTRQASAQPSASGQVAASPAPPAASPLQPELQKWFDAYHKAVAGLFGGTPQPAAQPKPATRYASTAPAPPRRVVPPPAPPLVSPPAPAVTQPAAPPPPPSVASQPEPSPVAPQETPQPVPQDDGGHDKQAAEAPDNSVPAAKPDGQSLAQALAFVADKMEREGRITVLAQFHDAAGDRDLVKQLSYRASNVTIDPNRCRLSFRGQVEEDGKPAGTLNHTVALRLVKDVMVETVDQALTDMNMRTDHPFPVHTDPKLYVVHIGRWGSAGGDDLYFRDKEMAARVGESMQHAQALCEDEPERRARNR